MTFSDGLPPTAGRCPRKRSRFRPAGSSTASLPVEVRMAASRFPVTLYTGPTAAPASARAASCRRGVPFTERTITTKEDAEALQRLSGSTSMPFATIGGQHIRGFSEASGRSTWMPRAIPEDFAAAPELPQPGSHAPAGGCAAAADGPRPLQLPSGARRQRPPAAAAPSDPSPQNPAGIRF